MSSRDEEAGDHLRKMIRMRRAAWMIISTICLVIMFILFGVFTYISLSLSSIGDMHMLVLWSAVVAMYFLFMALIIWIC